MLVVNRIRIKWSKCLLLFLVLETGNNKAVFFLIEHFNSSIFFKLRWILCGTKDVWMQLSLNVIEDLTLSGWVFRANLRNAFSMTLLSGSEGLWSTTLRTLQNSLNLWSFNKSVILDWNALLLGVFEKNDLGASVELWENAANFLGVCGVMKIKTETWPRENTFCGHQKAIVSYAAMAA